MLANMLFTAEHTAYPGHRPALLTGGFFRSLEFTAVNAIAYADIEPQAMSRATSFASVAQQVSLSLGVADRRAGAGGGAGVEGSARSGGGRFRSGLFRGGGHHGGVGLALRHVAARCGSGVVRSAKQAAARAESEAAGQV